MDNVAPAPSGTVPRPRHRPLFLSGILLFVLGPAIYFVQFRLKHFETPWYVPLLAAAGVVLMSVSTWRRRGVVRIILLVLFTILCGLEWYMLLIGTRSPVYTGPAQPGRKVPEFTAIFADGKPFTEKDLERGTSTVLVFFRGRW